MSSKIIIPAILNTYKPYKDGGYGLNFATNILSKEQKSIIDDLYSKPVFLMIKEGEISVDEIEILDKVDIDLRERTPSQNLRNVLYRCHEQDTAGFLDFKEYYKHQMQKLIDHFRNKLN